MISVNTILTKIRQSIPPPPIHTNTAPTGLPPMGFPLPDFSIPPPKIQSPPNFPSPFNGQFVFPPKADFNRGLKNTAKIPPLASFNVPRLSTDSTNSKDDMEVEVEKPPKKSPNETKTAPELDPRQNRDPRLYIQQKAAAQKAENKDIVVIGEVIKNTANNKNAKVTNRRIILICF